MSDTQQGTLFAGEGGTLKKGDRVRDPKTGRTGEVISTVPVHPQVWVQWAWENGLPGPVAAHLEAELERVQA